MSTHCGIGYIKADGTVDAIYCHNDGYPKHTLTLLKEKYNSLEAAKEIIALGDLSFLDERLNPIGPHSFDKPEKGTTIAYHRDRDEDWEDVHPLLYNNIEDYFANAGRDYEADYLYLYDKDKGWVDNNSNNYLDDLE